jgi:Ring finger domain
MCNDGQKFAKKNNLSSRRSSSFIVTQSSSFRLTNGANDIDIESNPSVSGMQQPTCAICLDRFRDGEDICSAQNKDCPHEYHLQCIFPWLLKSQDCPCCRRDYLAIEADVDEHHEETATSIVSTALHSI